MIQSIMLVALGFLIATLCALLLAPSFWRRAERLTTQRLERSMPMSIADTEADRDQLRASYAIIIRRLEAALSQEKTRCAGQLVKISQLEMEIARVNDQAGQLRGQLDAEHNAASVLRRTIATRVPELREAAQSARQLVHVRDHEIGSIVNRLRQREEALAIAQRTTEMQQAEITRLRQAMEMSGAQNSGRFKLRPTQWSIHDYRAEYDRLNLELSKLRERLSVAYDREANQVKQLRTELQQLADQIVTASAGLPERETTRAIAAPASDDQAETVQEDGDDLEAARSIDAILADETGEPKQMPALRATLPAQRARERGRSGGLFASALSPKRIAQGAAAKVAALSGTKTDSAVAASARPAEDAQPSGPDNTAKSGRLSAAELLGGEAAWRRGTQADGLERDAASEPDPPPPADEGSMAAKPQSSDSLYDSLRAAPPGSAPSRSEDASRARAERAERGAPVAETASDAEAQADQAGVAPSPEAGDTHEDADKADVAEETSDAEHAETHATSTTSSNDETGDPAETADTAAPNTRESPNGEDATAKSDDGEDADDATNSGASLLDRLKQVPEKQTR